MDTTPTGLKRPADTDPVAGTATTARQHANSIQSFTVNVASVGGSTVTLAVTFPTPFAVAPRVVAMASAGSPNVVSVSRTGSVTTTGFTLGLYRTTGSGTVAVDIIAIGEGTEVGG